MPGAPLTNSLLTMQTSRNNTLRHGPAVYALFTDEFQPQDLHSPSSENLEHHAPHRPRAGTSRAEHMLLTDRPTRDRLREELTSRHTMTARYHMKPRSKGTLQANRCVLVIKTMHQLQAQQSAAVGKGDKQCQGPICMSSTPPLSKQSRRVSGTSASPSSFISRRAKGPWSAGILPEQRCAAPPHSGPPSPASQSPAAAGAAGGRASAREAWAEPRGGSAGHVPGGS